MQSGPAGTGDTAALPLGLLLTYTDPNGFVTRYTYGVARGRGGGHFRGRRGPGQRLRDGARSATRLG